MGRRKRQGEHFAVLLPIRYLCMHVFCMYIYVFTGYGHTLVTGYKELNKLCFYSH